MITREQFVAEVLSWEGTPFHHMGRVKGVGVDCVGLAVGAARNIGIEVIDSANYPKFPIHGIFNQMVDSQTVPVDLCDVLPGDILKFKWVREPQHLAVVISTNPIRMIHAYSQVDMCVTSDFDVMWQATFTDARRFKEFA